MSEFKTRLRTMRLSRGWSQSQLADKMNVATSTVSMWERGEREPSFDTLEAIADVFNVPRSSLLYDVDAVFDEIGDLNELREILRRREDIRTLFSLALNSSEKDVKMAIDIFNAIKKNYG